MNPFATCSVFRCLLVLILLPGESTVRTLWSTGKNTTRLTRGNSQTHTYMGQNTISMCAIKHKCRGGLIVIKIWWPCRPSPSLPMFQIVKCPWRNHFLESPAKDTVQCVHCAQCIHLVGQGKKIKDLNIKQIS